MRPGNGARFAVFLMISGVTYPSLSQEIPPAMPGFSWLVDQRLAGMPRPGASRAVEEDLGFLGEQGIRVLVSLTEHSTDPVIAGQHGIEVLHIPIEDFTAPTLSQLETFLGAVEKAHADDRAVGVHCAAGKGRTGTFLAAYLVGTGEAAAEAIAAVRRRRPGSIETSAQEQILVELEKRLREAVANHAKGE